MKRAAWALGLFGILLAGCGGGGGDSGSVSDPFQRTSLGYPVVSGTYDTSVGRLTNNCSSDVGDPLVVSVVVSQTESQITAEAQSTAGLDALLASGWKIESASGAAGTVLQDAKFSLFEGETLVHASLGKLFVNYAYTGIFSPTGWSGTMSYTAFLEGATSSCTYTATFSGTKV